MRRRSFASASILSESLHRDRSPRSCSRRARGARERPRRGKDLGL